MKRNFLSTAIVGILLAAGLVSCASNKGKEKMSESGNGAWVLSYFLGQGNSAEENALFLAYSRDGLHWTELNGGKPAYVLEGIGGNRIRDPFVYRKKDGKFIMIATDWTIWQTENAVSEGYWSNPSPCLIIADSEDLITFTNPRRIDFAQLSDEALAKRQERNWGNMHAWAPEVFYDEGRGQYGVIWSGDGDLSGDSVINRTYVNYTKDFVTFSKPEVFFELKDSDGNNITEIDATITDWNGKYYMFFKGEAGEAKDIQEAVSTSLEPGSFVVTDPEKYVTRTTDQATQMFTEGPFVVKDPSKELWYLYADFYGRDGQFGCWATTSLDAAPEEWKQLDESEYSFPYGVRHANTVRVSDSELQKLISHR